MKIECPCGAHITDASDGLPHKAHLIEDTDYFPLLEQIDDLIENHCHTRAQREASLMKVRTLLSEATTSLWRCHQCDRIHIDVSPARTRSYYPDGD